MMKGLLVQQSFPERVLFIVIALLLLTTDVFGAHGVSIDGKLKYHDGFTHFNYTSESAIKGGDLVLHDLGGFDKMNPFTLKGNAPAGLGSLIFESLAVSSLDEPFAKYGLIAKDIALADDGLSVVFTLNKDARFSDGSKVTAKDIQFSLETIKGEDAHPLYQSYFKDIVRSEIESPEKIRFYFARKNRELHLIACELPVLSKKFYSKNPFGESSLVPPVGSGPYIAEKVDVGKTIVYRRNESYWAKDHPVRKNMFNYNTITYKYFKDQLVSVEAFKAGDFDLMDVNIAKQWVRDMAGSKFDQKKIIKKHFSHKNNAGMQAFVFNSRKPIFADPMVRKALGLAFDFEWTNKSLFFDQYTRNDSYFSNSELGAKGLPKGLELDYLKPFKDQLPAEVFTTPLTSVSTKSPSSLRKNLRMAKKILTEAGWVLKDRVLVKKDNPQLKLSFEILLVSPSFERVIAPFVNNLKKLGVEANSRTIDPSLYTRRIKDFDFEMVVSSFGQSQSPGNEQRAYWHSSTADRKGSRNMIGIKNPVVDALVDRIIYATSQEQLQAACSALDRVLWYGYYVVPNWHVPKHRIAYWNKFGKPDQLPLYYNSEQLLLTWWMK